MRRIVRVIAAALVVASCQRAAEVPVPTAARVATPPSPAVAIRNVTLVGETGELTPGTTVLIRDGRIAQVARDADADVPAGAQVVDGSGRFLIPGLWDAHAHLTYVGECGLPLMMAHGVTSCNRRGGGWMTDDRAACRAHASELHGKGTAGPL